MCYFRARLVGIGGTRYPLAAIRAITGLSAAPFDRTVSDYD